MTTLPILNMMKAQMVIESCQTFAQLDMANNYITRVVEANLKHYRKEYDSCDSWFMALEDNAALEDLYFAKLKQIENG